MKYEVIIEETITQVFKIEANDLEEAKEIAIKEYNKGNIVLDSAEVQEKKIKVISNNETNNEIDWEEF